ncbi:MAG: hypothetical protein ACREUU_20230 [Gammaproteobacteria bacterium]
MRIHLLDSDAVERELVENRLNERARATYLTLAWIISTLIGYSTLIFSNVSRTWMGLLEGVSLVVVITCGFVYTFTSNGGQAGRDFVARFTCLLVPASIKANLIVWVLFYVLGWGYQAMVPKLSFPSKESADLFAQVAPYMPSVMIYVANVAVLILMFTMIARHLQRIGRGVA